MDTIGFAVVGAQNFAADCIDQIRSLDDEGVRLTAVAVADPVESAGRVRELRSAGVRVFDSFERLLRGGQRSVDVVCLPVSIPSHAETSVEAMEYGYDVLLEKPPAPTVGELDAIRRTADRTGQSCSIGFQYLHSPSVRRLKRALLDGAIGELQEIACKGFWPRTTAYYERNPWAGTLVHEGDVVLDGPVQNAFAHFLQNALFLAGEDLHGTASLSAVRAERYRANPDIWAADVACLLATTTDGVDLSFTVTHAADRRRDPVVEVVGSDGCAEWRYGGEATVRTDGERRRFHDGDVDPRAEVFRTTADHCRGTADRLYATPENTRSLVVAFDGSFESSQGVTPIPTEAVERIETDGGDVRYTVDGLEAWIDEAFERRVPLSDTAAPWAEQTQRVSVTDYRRFSPFA